MNNVVKDIKLDQGSLAQQLSKFNESQLKQLLSQSNQWADYMSQTNLMTKIAQEMKEIAVLPSEVVKPKDSNPLTKVEFLPDGGVLTWMEGQEYPYKGYPYFEFVDKIDFIKKVTRAFASGLYHRLKSKNKIWFLTLLPGVWIAKAVVRAEVYVFYRVIERFKVKKERYCTAMRELHRAFSASLRETEFASQLRDLVCMVLEYDNAYRFRIQDVLAELDKEKAQRNPTGELLRLLDLMMKRERTQEIRDTWRLAKYLIRFYLRFDGKLTLLLKDVLLELDLEKVKLSIEDKSYCIPRKDYAFGFMGRPDKEESRLIELWNLRESWIENEKKIQNESTIAHEKLLSLDTQEEEQLVSSLSSSSFNGGLEKAKKELQARQLTRRLKLDVKYTDMIEEAEKSYTQEKSKLQKSI